jgi:hypothetical protein
MANNDIPENSQIRVTNRFSLSQPFLLPALPAGIYFSSSSTIARRALSIIECASLSLILGLLNVR